MVADEARERGRTALLEGYLQGACGRDLIRRRAGSWCWQEGEDNGTSAVGVEKQLREGLGVASMMEGRWRGKGWRHTPLISLFKVGGLHCKEPVLWQEHSGHVVAEAHLRDRS